MYDGDKAVLTMVQYLKEDKEKDENSHRISEGDGAGTSDPALRQSF